MEVNISIFKEHLEELVLRYNVPSYIDNDPIQIPHSFSDPENVAIAGFLASSIAWGNRKSIITNALRMMKLMDNNPYDFVLHASTEELDNCKQFVHRTFNGDDFVDFILMLRSLYTVYGGLHRSFADLWLETGDMRMVLSGFRKRFLEGGHAARCEKHVSNIEKQAACKRLNMFLRWMVRRDSVGVDFGLWTEIPMSALYIPLDVHSGTVARGMGLLQRTQNDWRAVEELNKVLCQLDPMDPVKYDFALFGFGVNEGRMI